jgi:hypothetical protein
LSTIAIMGHGAAEAIFQRNLPLWVGKADQMLVLCPKDDPIKSIPSNAGGIVSGSQGIYSEAACRRLVEYLKILKWAADCPLFLCEYDSGPVREIPWHLCELSNTLFSNGWTDGDQFVAHPPYMMNRTTLGILAEHLQDVIDRKREVRSDLERIFSDRFIGTAVADKKVWSLSWERNLNRGFTRNTIEPGDIPRLREYLLDHPDSMVHGIKSQEALDVVLKFSK